MQCCHDLLMQTVSWEMCCMVLGLMVNLTVHLNVGLLVHPGDFVWCLWRPGDEIAQKGSESLSFDLQLWTINGWYLMDSGYHLARKLWWGGRLWSAWSRIPYLFLTMFLQNKISERFSEVVLGCAPGGFCMHMESWKEFVCVFDSASPEFRISYY